MSGQAFLVTFAATGKSDSPVRGETQTQNHHANKRTAEPEQKAARMGIAALNPSYVAEKTAAKTRG
jgi:hypothetical protein